MKYLNQICALCILVLMMFASGCATTAYISSVNDLGLSKETYEGDSVYVKGTDKIMSIDQKETKRLIEDTMSRMGYEIKKSNDAHYLLVFGSEQKTSQMSGSRPVTNTAVTNVYSGGQSALATTSYTSYVPYSYDYTVAKLYTYLMPTRNLKPLYETEIIWEGYIGAESSVMKKNKAALIDQLFEKLGEDYAKHTYVGRKKSTTLVATKEDSRYSPELIKEWRLAAEEGNAEAQYNLGFAYYFGEGVAKDAAEAEKWWRKAAEQGHSAGYFIIGLMYFEGDGVPKDDVEAVKWYRKAAEQGYADAQYTLGLMYDNGEGVSEDDVEAVKWYRKAAEQGYADAQYTLGVMYANGEGVPEDDVSAYMWYNLAAAQGNEFAKEQILSHEMTKEQIAEAQKLSREWLAKRSK